MWRRPERMKRVHIPPVSTTQRRKQHDNRMLFELNALDSTVALVDRTRFGKSCDHRKGSVCLVFGFKSCRMALAGFRVIICSTIAAPGSHYRSLVIVVGLSGRRLSRTYGLRESSAAAISTKTGIHM